MVMRRNKALVTQLKSPLKVGSKQKKKQKKFILIDPKLLESLKGNIREPQRKSIPIIDEDFK